MPGYRGITRFSCLNHIGARFSCLNHIGASVFPRRFRGPLEGNNSLFWVGVFFVCLFVCLGGGCLFVCFFLSLVACLVGLLWLLFCFVFPGCLT